MVNHDAEFVAMRHLADAALSHATPRRSRAKCCGKPNGTRAGGRAFTSADECARAFCSVLPLVDDRWRGAHARFWSSSGTLCSSVPCLTYALVQKGPLTTFPGTVQRAVNRDIVRHRSLPMIPTIVAVTMAIVAFWVEGQLKNTSR